MSLPGEKVVSFSFCSPPEEREPLLSTARSFEQPQDNTAANLLDRELTPITREYKKNACTPNYNQEQINFKKRHGFVTDFSGFSLDVLTDKIQNASVFDTANTDIRCPIMGYKTAFGNTELGVCSSHNHPIKTFV